MERGEGMVGKDGGCWTDCEANTAKTVTLSLQQPRLLLNYTPAVLLFPSVLKDVPENLCQERRLCEDQTTVHFQLLTNQK